MTCSLLNAAGRRQITGCRRNTHVDALHPDRILPDEHDLIYMISGEWELFQEDQVYLVRPGDAILLHAGLHHYSLRPCSGTIHTFFAHFSLLPGDRLLPVAQPIDSPESWLFPTHLHLPASSPVPGLMEQLIHAYWSHDIYAPRRASDYLSLVLSELSLSVGVLPSSQDEQVDKLCRMMEIRLDRFFSVPEMCEILQVSPKTLHTYFVHRTGMAPHAWQMERKLLLVRQDLEQFPGITLRQLAEKYGFCDEYHLSKRYKARFGVPPRFRDV